MCSRKYLERYEVGISECYTREKFVFSASLPNLSVKSRSLLQKWLQEPRDVSTKFWFRNVLKNSHLETKGSGQP
jgi:hypothetical protein